MKTKLSICLFLFAAIIIFSCKDNGTESESQTGKIIFAGVKTLPSQSSAASSIPNDIMLSKKFSNIYKMHTTDLLLTVREIWVSKGTITPGGADNLTWIKIGENTQQKLFSDYTFTAENLSAGVYNSVKIIFKNVFYRTAVYQSDHNSSVTMKETMSSYLGSCTDDNALANVNYFCSSGCYYLINNKFTLQNPNENIPGFEIRAGKTTRLYWKMGDERSFDPYSFVFDWIDENNNGVWDCGVDRMDNFTCLITPPIESMWKIIPVYE